VNADAMRCYRSAVAPRIIPPAQLAADATFSDETTVLSILRIPALPERYISAQPLCGC